MKRCVIILSNYILYAKILDDPVILTPSKDVKSVMEMKGTHRNATLGVKVQREQFLLKFFTNILNVSIEEHHSVVLCEQCS